MDENRKKEILKELNGACVLLGTIPMCGDALDAMAAAKAMLRRAAGLVKECGEQDGEDGGPSSDRPSDGHLPPKAKGLRGTRDEGREMKTEEVRADVSEAAL